MRWMPHKAKNGSVYSLVHLHPFRYSFVLQEKNSLPEKTIQVQIAFGLHCFTKEIEASDCPGDLYADGREKRTFERLRYELSKQLPSIARTLVSRHCSFAKNENYVTVDCTTSNGDKHRYGVFFNLKRMAPMTVLITIQSAYSLSADQQEPGRGRIRFNALVGHALRGTRPKMP